MRWEKLGLIFSPNGNIPWMNSHAAVPIAEQLKDSIFKIYFSCRDKLNRSYTGYVVIDISNPQVILEVSSTPILQPGELGEFDDSGTMATWLVNYQNKKYLYYIGWNLGVTVPFRNSIGLSIADSNGVFHRYSNGPIIDRTINEPHFSASCCVIPDYDIWRMWYLSCTGWFISDGKPYHKYHIKYAESKDGINWNRTGLVAIDFSEQNEYAISRPSVIKENGVWKMWFSYRGPTYKIGYAESFDGKTWKRLDHQAGIDVSKTGWDSEMIEYPFVFKHNQHQYMLYNGNSYGKSGFGLAILKTYK